MEKNAKLWYQEVSPDVLSTYWGRFDKIDPNKAAFSHLYRIMAVKKGEKEDEHEVRRIKWEELVCVMQSLEGKSGYDKMDGREAYTRDEKESHKSNVLGG